MTAPRMYRKTALAEARQYVPGDTAELVDLLAWCGGRWTSGDEPVITVPTLEGPLAARPGDWILRGPRGEFWPVRAEVFEETYEPVSDPDEISDEEFEAAKADVIARFGSVPPSLQDVIDRGGRFGLPSVPSPPDGLAAELDSAAAAIFDGTLGDGRSWLLECAAAGTHLEVVAASLLAAARIAREKAAGGSR